MITQGRRPPHERILYIRCAIKIYIDLHQLYLFLKSAGAGVMMFVSGFSILGYTWIAMQVVRQVAYLSCIINV